MTIHTTDRRQGVYLIGKPGTGKSTLIQNMVIQDMRRGNSVTLVDPHGDLIEQVLRHVPRHRTNDVVIIDPSDTQRPVGLNILQTTDSQDNELVASSIVSIFRHLWAESWGPRTEYTLYNTIAALLDMPHATLLDAYRMLIDQEFRGSVTKYIQDPMVRLYWEQVFARYTDRFRQEVISPIQNKVGQLLTGVHLRNIVGQANATIDLAAVLNGPYILLVNLSKGKIGEDKAHLLGSLIITKLYLAALERQTIPEESRQDSYLYVDEAHSFAIHTSILSEARKYRLNLTLGNQYLQQFPLNMRHSLFGNIGTWIVFRVGAEDADMLEPDFAPYIKTEQLRNQRNHQVAYKLLYRGISMIPASSPTPPPPQLRGDEADHETIIRISRERYGRSREEVERRIATSWKGSSLSFQTRQRP